ncbi:MAG TPA: DEAD/DEAH box helicase [Syntrophomonadaceae bacterium]|nr:DEAD/DEAH box helicase [Syntrophomonadaceae bacterium]
MELPAEDVEKLGTLIRERIGRDIRQGTQYLQEYAPTCLVLFLVGLENGNIRMAPTGLRWPKRGDGGSGVPNNQKLTGERGDMGRDFLLNFFNDRGWELVYTIKRPPRPQSLFQVSELPLSDFCRRFITAKFPNGLFRHQIEALHSFLDGSDVGITTGTASGKSAIFYAAAIEAICRDPGMRVLAIYPLKALAREQEQRWTAAFGAAGLPPNGIARLDGDVPVSQRIALLRKAAVVVATPDILHAWLLPNIGDSVVYNFIRQLRLIVVDEVHVYTGVFGSNAAFLFRRLEHIMAIAGSRTSYIVASATINEPLEHFRALFGRNFSLIDESFDTSGQHELEIFMVRPETTRDLLTSISKFLQELARRTTFRFIAFVDSRKQTELVATILKRGTDQEDSIEDIGPDMEHLKKLEVLPYRAGFEEEDRAIIQDRLTSGKLRGVISTSALELGIDIPHLDAGILVGVPRSNTSLLQRIGRIGRQHPGIVVILHNGDLYSEAVFRKPEEIFNRPLAEGALYLENPRVQYIHAMCLARIGGEHDQACIRAGRDAEDSFTTEVNWPPGFVTLCEEERAGEVPTDLQSMKMEAGDMPHHVYPLRDVESQFTVELHQGPHRERLGSLSYGQVMREAYPGAIYYYTTIPHRVYQVLPRAKVVRVRRERYYTTRPLVLPSAVFPNLSPGNVHRAGRLGELFLIEANLQIKETVCGFKERRGSTEITERYPLSPSTGIKALQEFFSRNYFTTGVIIVHPTLALPGVNVEELAQLIYECFLMEIPFERQDINWSAGKLRITRGPLEEGTRFIALYDQTYGSLRLSGRLLEPGVLGKVLNKAEELVRVDTLFSSLTEETVKVLQTIAKATQETFAEQLELAAVEAAPVLDSCPGQRIQIILPGSVGLDQLSGNIEFFVEGVFYSPREGGLRYRGRHVYDSDPDVKITIPVENLIPVPGESRLGWYDLETGEIIEV